MADPHGPNTLTKYINVHRSHMKRLLAQGFVVRDDCDFTALSDKVLLDGPIYCKGDIRLDVTKTLTILQGSGGQSKVQTVKFKYHASRRGRNIWRYCFGDHRSYPHKHTYAFFGNGEETSVKNITGSVPVLNVVIEELWSWFDANRDRLERAFASDKPG